MPGLSRQCFAFKRRLWRPFFRIRYFNSLNVSCCEANDTLPR